MIDGGTEMGVLILRGNEMKKFWVYAAAILIVAYANFASAVSQTCLSIQQSAAGGGCTGSCLANFQLNHPECFGSTSSTASASQEISSTSLTQMLAISRAVNASHASSNLRPENISSVGQFKGMAAGNSAPQWNFWGSVSSDKNKYDRGGYYDPIGLAAHNNIASSDVTNAVIGGDYQLAPDVALGLSAAFDSGSGSAQSFNLTAGTNNLSSNSTSGYSIAPYLGWQINNAWSLDASLGAGSVKLSTSEVSGKADRLFYGANLNYANWLGNWQLTGKGGYLHGEEKYADLTGGATGLLMTGTATTNKITQLRVGGQAGYWTNENVMPYFGLNYTSDISRSTSANASAQLGNDIGRTAWVYSLGVNLFAVKNSITGGVAYNQEAGRSYAKNNSLMGNVNFRF